MRKVMKKIVASLATVAMAVGLFATMPAQEAKAAVGGDGKVYLVGEISGNNWTPTTAPEMTTEDGKVFTYTYTVTEKGAQEFKILVGDNTGWNGQDKGYSKDISVEKVKGGNGGNFKVEYSGAGEVTITATFDGSTLKSVKASGVVADEPEKPAAEDYHVVGVKELTGYSWADDKDSDGKIIYGVEMTEGKNGDFSVKFENVKKGDHSYKILQDPENKAWKYVYYSVETKDDGFGGQNSVVKVKEDGSTVEIIINKTTKTVTAKVTDPKGKTEVESKENPTTKPAETTTAAPATTDKGDVVSKDEAAKFEKEAVVEGQPEGAALKATEIAADSDAFKAVKEVAKTDLKNRTYVAVDFKLLKGTEAVQPNGDVKITMPVPEKLKNAKQVEVFRMGDDGKLVNLGKADVTDSKITFTTNHFSTYVFAEVKTATGTGDVAPIIALLAVAAVAGAMVVASRKKTVNE